jgi:hypothetical protein
MVGWVRRRGIEAEGLSQATAMTTGVMLLMSIWSGQRSGIAFDASRAIADVRTCMDVLKRVEPRSVPSQSTGNGSSLAAP